MDPQLDDPTTVLATLYAELAPTLLQRGTLDHYATHVALPALGDALNNLGFGRSSVYAVRPPRPRQWSSDVEIRIGTTHDLDTITNLSYIEMKQRFEPPIYSPPHPSNQDHARAYHAGLLDQGALHFIARRGGHDVGLVTVEFVSRAPRLCPDGQPYIGSTATHPSSRGRGVGHALVDAALDWAYRHDFHSVSVDFQSANPLSRPFWLGAGFRPTGYGITRSIHPSFAPKPGM